MITTEAIIFKADTSSKTIELPAGTPVRVVDNGAAAIMLQVKGFFAVADRNQVA